MEFVSQLKDNMGEVVQFESGLLPEKRLSEREYRRLANVIFLQFNQTEFKILKVGRLGNRVNIEVEFPGNIIRTVKL